MDQELPVTAQMRAPTTLPEVVLGATAYIKGAAIRFDKQETDHYFPVVGDTLANCLLLAELGRGSIGQVFLAQQETLGNRPVVLKVTTGSDQEQLNLARLQHTHIMPLYWADALPEKGLRIIAMPYLARTTLAGLLCRLEAMPRASWNGQRIFAELQADQDPVPIHIPVQDHPAQALKQLSWIDFVVRLGQAIAEALAYAHQRNLLHLDLKPANILISPDSSPILLDLDVARQPIPAGSTTVPWLGGTPLYVSPEQDAAMQALLQNQPIPTAVDGRSDQYSLGLVLYHALGGALTQGVRPNLDRLRVSNPGMSPGLVDILARCLAEKPHNRYPDCNALAEDLDRHLHDLPLRGVPNRLGERCRKWSRHHPYGLHLILLLIGFCISAAGAGFWQQLVNTERRQQAENALLEGQEWQRKGQPEAAVGRFLTGLELAEQTQGAGPLVTQLKQRLRTAQRLQKADELKKVVHLLRFYSLQEHTPRRLRHVLEAAARKLWSERAALLDNSSGKLEKAAEKNLRDQFQELVLLWSDLQVQLAPSPNVPLVRSGIRKVLAEAEQIFGPSLALALAQQQHGNAALPPANLQPQSAWEYCALGRLALKKGQLADMDRHWQKAVEIEPYAFVPNFYWGIGALRQQKYGQAAQAFSFCLGQDPCAECFLLRGQCLAALGETERALQDFNLALAKSPELAIVYQHRALLQEKLGRLQEAKRDRELAGKLSD